MAVFIKRVDPENLEEIIEVRDKGELKAIIRHLKGGIEISALAPGFIIVSVHISQDSK